MNNEAEMDILRKNKKELQGIGNTMIITEVRISELEDMSIETLKMEKQRKKTEKIYN